MIWGLGRSCAGIRGRVSYLGRGVGMGWLGGGIVQKNNSPDLRFAEVGISAFVHIRRSLLLAMNFLNMLARWFGRCWNRLHERPLHNLYFCCQHSSNDVEQMLAPCVQSHLCFRSECINSVERRFAKLEKPSTLSLPDSAAGWYHFPSLTHSVILKCFWWNSGLLFSSGC